MVQATMKADSMEGFGTDNIRALPTQNNQDSVIGMQKRFLTIEETADQTGLSVYFLRQGIKKGWIPYVRCGCKAMINLPKLIAVLDEMSAKNIAE